MRAEVLSESITEFGYDNSGICSHKVELAVIDTMVGGEIACGLWEGGETRLGNTCWQAIDSSEPITCASAPPAEAAPHPLVRTRAGACLRSASARTACSPA
jgi:hypothetical protein